MLFFLLVVSLGCGRTLHLDDVSPDAGEENAVAWLVDDGGRGDAMSVEPSLQDAISETLTESSGATCPPCESRTCFASGCHGDAISNGCDTPYELASGQSLTAAIFVCPEASKVKMPSTSACAGGMFGVGAFRLVAGNWSVKLIGLNAVLAIGSCITIEGCGGGASSTSRNVIGPTMIMVGTTNTLDACVKLNVEITAL